MREKKRWLLVTFHTTTGAIAMESLCKVNQLAGRLIPTPRSITADCGMGWRAELTLRRQLEEITASLDTDGWYEIEI